VRGTLSSVFERFTEQARQVVVLAQESARELNHVYVGPEHLLLALLADGQEIPARVLASFGVGQEIVRVREPALDEIRVRLGLADPDARE
jgi:ATP-dependent Clp protease ATP-binding subunit ClpA